MLADIILFCQILVYINASCTLTYKETILVKPQLQSKNIYVSNNHIELAFEVFNSSLYHAIFELQ